MQVNHKIYRGIKQTENYKDYYDYYDDDKYYSKYYQKSANSNEKYKKDKHLKRESSSREDDFDRYSYTTKVSHKSMWGSKTFVTKNSLESNKLRPTKKSKKLSDTTYFKNQDKKEIKHTKKLKRILKCLIQFNKSRRELYGKYFDIWYDKTFYYYDVVFDKNANKKSNNKKYESENKYNYKYNDYYNYNDINYYKGSKKYDKKAKNKFSSNIVPKNEIKDKSSKTNYYMTYSNINNYYQDNSSYKSQKKSNKKKNLDKDYYNDYYPSSNSNNKVKYYKEINYSTKRKKEVKPSLNDDRYYSDSYYEEYDKEKVSSNKKKNKKFSKKLLYILNKYLIERKEKSYCFNKWIDFITSIYLYNGEGAYNDLGGKSQHKSNYDKNSITYYDNYEYSAKKNNDKSNQKDEYKYYEDYDETQDKKDSLDDNTENHTYYYYNNQNKNYTTNENNLLSYDKKEIYAREDNYDSYYGDENTEKFYNVKNKTYEDPNKVVTYTTYNKEPKITTNKYIKYEKKIIEDPIETEDKIISINSNQLSKLKDFNVIDDQIVKEMNPNVIKNENGYKVLEFTKSFPEKTIISHKKETKIEVLGRNDKNNRSMKSLNKNEYYIKGNEYINLEEFDSPLRENKSLAIAQNRNRKDNQIENLKMKNYSHNTFNKSNNIYLNNNDNIIKDSNNSIESKKSKKSKNKNSHNEKRKKLLTKLLKKDTYKYTNLLNKFEKWIDFTYNSKQNIQKTDSKKVDINSNVNEGQKSNKVNKKVDSENNNNKYIQSEFVEISAYEDDNYLKMNKKYAIKMNKNSNLLNNKFQTDYWKTNIKEPSYSDNDFKSQKSLNKFANNKEILIRNVVSNNERELLDSDKKLPNQIFTKVDKKNIYQDSFEDKNLNQKIPGRNRENGIGKNKKNKHFKNNTLDEIYSFKTPEKLSNNLVNYLPHYINPETFRTIDKMIMK